VVATKLLYPSNGGVSFTVIFLLAVLSDNGLGKKRNNLLDVRMHDAGTQKLVIEALPVTAGVFPQALGAADVTGGIETRAVQDDKVAAVQKLELFEGLSLLEFPQNGVVRRPKLFAGHGIEDLSKLGVTGHVLDLEEGFEIRVFALTIVCEQGGHLEGKDGQSAGEGVGHTNLDVLEVGAMFWDVIKFSTNDLIESVGT